MNNKSNSKKVFYTSLLLLIVLSVGFSLTMGSFLVGFNGRVISLDGLPVGDVLLKVDCEPAGWGYWEASTDSNGDYQFNDYSEYIFCDGDSCDGSCELSSSESSVSDTQEFTILNGKIVLVANTVNGVYNAYKGYQCFDFSNVAGTITDSNGLLIRNRPVVLNCGSNLQTVYTNEDGNYEFTYTDYLVSCSGTDVNTCRRTCTVTSLDSTPTSSNSFSITAEGKQGSCSSKENIIQTIDFDYDYSADVTGTFTPTTSVYGPSFNEFIFTADSLSGGQTVEYCKYSASNQDYQSMTQYLAKSGNDYTAIISPTGSGDYTYFVACQTTTTLEDASHTESVTYTVDLDDPVINTVINDTSNLLSVPLNVTVVVEEDAKCQVSNTDTGYSYSSINCSSTYANNTQCNLSNLSLTQGVNNFFISCVDAYGNYHDSGENRLVSYNIDSINPQYTTLSESLQFFENETAEVNWTITDANPAYYEYYFEGLLDEFNTWTSPELIEKTVDTTTPGSYNYTLFFNDTFGRKNASTIIVEVIDDSIPIIVINSPIPDSEFTNSVISMNVSLNEDGSACFASYSGSNHSMTQHSLTSYGLIDAFNQGNNNVIFYCNDSYNTTGVNNTNFLIDYSPPYVVANNASSTLSMNTTNNISWVLADTYSTGFYNISINGTNYQPSSAWNNNTRFNVLADTNRGLGYWEYTIYYNDNLGNSDNDTVSVRVVDLSTPIITITSPQPTLYGNTQITMNVSLNEDGSACFASYSGSNHSMTQHSLTSYGLIDAFNQGNNNVIFYCNDSFNNTGFNSVSFEIDVLNPSVEVLVNDSVLELGIDSVNNTLIASDAHLSQCVFNASYPNNSLITKNSGFDIVLTPVELIETGTYLVSAYCNDTMGNSNYTTSSFSVSDTIGPVVSLHTPSDTGLTGGAVLFNCSASNNELKNSTLYGNWSNGWHANHTLSMTGKWDYTNFTKELNSGFYEWNCRVCDESNNCNFSVTNYTFEVDNTNPSVEVIINDSVLEYQVDSVNNSLIKSDAHLDSCLFTVSYPNATQLIQTTGGDIILGPGQLTALGYYSVNAYCNDSLSNENFTSKSFQVLDNMPPVISINNPNQQYYTNNQVSFNITLDDEVEWCGVRLDAEAYNRTMQKLDDYNYGYLNGYTQDPHIITFYCNDSAGNTGNNQTTFTIEMTPPIIENITYSLINETVISQGMNNTLICDVSDALPGVSRVLFQSYDYGINTIGNSYSYNVTCSSTMEYWSDSVFANDTLGNNNTVISNDFVWYCDTLPPSITNCGLNNSLLYDSQVSKLKCDVSENGYSSVNTTIFGTSTGVINAFKGAGSEWYYDFTCNQTTWTSLNNYTLSWSNTTSNDLVNNEDTISHSYFLICDPFPPSIDTLPAVPDSLPKDSTVCLTSNITDYPGHLNKVWVNISVEPYLDDEYSSIQYLVDDGTGCDASPNDGMFSYELTLLDYGYYTIKSIRANDTGNQEAYRNVQDTVISYDNSPPEIKDWEVMTENYNLTSGEEAMLRARVQDAPNGVDKVLFEVSGVNYTHTTRSFDWYEYNLTCSYDYDYNWVNIFANDTANNLAIQPVNMANITCDVYAPTIANTRVDDVSVTQAEGFCVNVTVNDTHLDNVWVMTTSPAGSVYNYTLFDTGSTCGGVAGDNVYGANIQPLTEYGDWFVNTTFANDTYNHVSVATPINLLVEVSAEDNPFIGLCNPNNTLLQNGDAVRLSCTVTDDEGLNTVLFTLNNTNTTITGNYGNTYYYDEVCTTNYNINWSMVFANDTGTPTNNSYYYLNEMVYCDVENPSTSGVNYENYYDLNDYLCFNATITDNDLVSNPILTLDYPNNTLFTLGLFDNCASGCCGTGGDNVYGVRYALKEAGNYTLFNVTVNDRVGNTNYSTINDEVVSSDVFNPSINNIRAVPNGSLNQYTIVNINATITDYSLDYHLVHIITPTTTMDYYLNDTIGSIIGDDIYGAVLNLTERGQYNIQYVYANDTYGNAVNTYSVILIDSNDVYPPVVNNVTVIPNGTLNVYSNVTVSATVTDNDALRRVWFTYKDSDNTIHEVNMSNVVGDYWQAEKNLTNVGVYDFLNVSALDNDDNLVNYSINEAVTSNDTISPWINNVIIAPAVRVDQYTNVCFNSTIFENDVLTSKRLYLNYPNSTEFTRELNDTCTTGCCGVIGDDIYGVIVNLTEPGNYSINSFNVSDANNNTDSMFLGLNLESVDVFSPIVEIISPVNATYDTHEVTLSFNIPNEDYINATWYNVNNTGNVSCNTVESLYFEDGHYNIQVYANDSYSNLGMSSVEFSVNVADNIKDLSVSSVSVPTNAYSHEIFPLNANISNEGNVDVVNATLKVLIDGNVNKTEYITVMEGADYLYNANLSIYDIGSHNITVLVEPLIGESDVTDNSGADFVTISSYLSEISATISAPKFVAPNTNFTTKLYLYNYADKSLIVNSNLTVPISFTQLTSNPSIVSVPSTGLNTSEWLSTTGSNGDYSITTESWITGQPGIKVKSKNIEVKNPQSPLFSIDVTVLPPVFVVGSNNTVIADIYNYGNETATNVNATIIVPPEITVFGALTHNMSDLVNGTSNQTTWIITPTQSGDYNISVIAQYHGGSDSDNETVAGEDKNPDLSVNSISYDDSVENNTIIDYYFTVSNSGDGDASSVIATLVLNNNTVPIHVNQSFNLNAGNSKDLHFNFTAFKEGTGKSFKLIVQHANSSYYYEKLNSYEVWLDNTPPSGIPTVNGYSTVEGYNLISWTPVDDAYKYYIYKGINGITDFNKSAPNATVSYTITSWIDTNVELNKWYYYRVGAVDYAGNIGDYSEYVKVVPKDFFTQEEEVEELQEQISGLQEQIEEQQNVSNREAQINSDINTLLSDMYYFNNISELLSPSEYQKINSVLISLKTAESKDSTGNKEVWLNQAKYQLSQFPEYSIGTQRYTYSGKVQNLTIDTVEELLSIVFNEKNHNKYNVRQRISNEYSNELTNITLFFEIPSDAIIVDSADYEVVNDTLKFTIESLKPGEVMDVSYEFYTTADYINDLFSGSMNEVIPPEPPKPITGFVGSMFSEVQEVKFNPYYIALVWMGVIIIGLAYFQKTRLVNWYNKVKDYVVNDEDDEDLIRIKMEKE